MNSNWFRRVWWRFDESNLGATCSLIWFIVAGIFRRQPNLPKGCFGSLRDKARSEIRRHVTTNPELCVYRRGILGRTADFILKDKGPIWFFCLYLATIALLIALNFFLCILFPEFLKQLFPPTESAGSILDDINWGILSLQTTLIAILFPIAIGLVSVLLQQRSQAPSSTRVDIYYRESRAMEIGGSSITLIVALIAQQFNLAIILSNMLSDTLWGPLNVSFFKTTLTAIHGVWVSLNALAIWQFLVVSFNFVHPDAQKSILRRFMACEFPRHSEDQISQWYFFQPESFGLLPHQEDGHPHIYFMQLGKYGIIEVERHHNGRQTLHDVRFNLLKWFILRWLSRTNRSWNPSEHQSLQHQVPKLIFPLAIGQKSSGHVYICRREGGSDLIRFEKFIIKYSFVFRKEKE